MCKSSIVNTMPSKPGSNIKKKKVYQHWVFRFCYGSDSIPGIDKHEANVLAMNHRGSLIMLVALWLTADWDRLSSKINQLENGHTVQWSLTI